MFYKHLRKHRELLGFTQTKLSFLSGVSLPTIQIIEAGRANPELETVQRLLLALGMKAQFVVKKADWDFLSLCGVPLTILNSSERPKPQEVCTKDRFIEEMRLALLECHALKDFGKDSDHNSGEKARKLKAIGATLMALRTHYPSVYAEFLRSEIAKKLLSQSGLEKLRRIALVGLMEFL